MPATILIVDDEEGLQHFVAEFIRSKGYEVLLASDGASALQVAQENWLDAVILDLKLPDMSGVDVLRQLRQENNDLPVIMITGYGEVGSAVEAMRVGAYDYLEKPLKLDVLQAAVEKALESGWLRQEIRRLREASGTGGPSWIMGESRAMLPVVFTIERVKNTDASVILQGESGTGKEVVANYIHQHSPRAHKRMVAINCAAIPDNLLESELFGYEPGGFTGAKKMKKGQFELADGGTLFLDEIGNMKEDLQAKLLRALETRSFTRIGGMKPIQIDVRIIAATNRNLNEAMKEGKFREDLFYRLGVFVIHLPPLRERKQDIKLFIASFLSEFHARWGKPVPHVSGEALAMLEAYRWPGNIRELRNVIERAVILCDGDEILPAHLPQDIVAAGSTQQAAPAPTPAANGSGSAAGTNGHGATKPASGAGLTANLAQFEKQLIAETIRRNGGDISASAKELKITPSTLREKMERHGVKGV